MLLNWNLETILVILALAWLAGITFFGVRFINSFKKLTKDISNQDLKTLLEDILKKIDLTQKEARQILEKIEEIEKKGIFHFQKVGLVRYNPFSDTGGDQSFVLALLDGKDDGVIITSLHSRDQTRVFAKPIEKGKESGYEFSKEEIEAIVRAKKGKIK
jgi:hypothetical protein